MEKGSQFGWTCRKSPPIIEKIYNFTFTNLRYWNCGESKVLGKRTWDQWIGKPKNILSTGFQFLEDIASLNKFQGCVELEK